MEATANRDSFSSLKLQLLSKESAQNAAAIALFETSNTAVLLVQLCISELIRGAFGITL